MTRPLSTNMDIDSLRYPSWCLSRLLDTIIGTKKVVALRRKCSTMFHYINNVYLPHMKFHSGSNGEGFDLPSSDLDIMAGERNIVVLESIHGTRSVGDNKAVLLMKRECCDPGFVMLQLLNKTNNDAIRESIVDYYNYSVVSSILFRDVYRQVEFGQVGNGPCNTFQGPDGGDIDIAVCFECNKWPTEANEFVYRQRLHGWPGKSLLDKIICRGCHLVPIGSKISDLTYIQWRLSFSAAEKDLVHSFNHTQFLTYGLLKIFLKQFLNKFHLLKGILCSYFLKTVMFYSIESTPSFLWRDDLLILCFWLCINKLIAWVEKGYCPNYFVQQNNMFRNKVFGPHRHNLLRVLNYCKRIGWTCIYLCEDLQELQSVVGHPELLNSSGLILRQNEHEFALDIEAVNLINVSSYSNKRQMLKVLARSLTLFSHSRTQQEEGFSALILYSTLASIGLSNFCIDVNTNNKDKYKTLRKSQRFLVTPSERLGYLKFFDMATFYYKTEQYLKAIHVLERVMSIWKPYVLYHSIPHARQYHSHLYQRYVCGQRSNLIDKVKSAYVFDIFIKYKNKQFYPAELSYNGETVAPFYLCVPPLPYTMFLLFLCHHQLGNIDRSLTVFHDLEVLVYDEIQGGTQYPVVFNMLAFCLDKLGNKHDAVQMCLLSQELKPDGNGADKLLDKILSSL